MDPFSRRQLLRMSGLAVGLGALAACGGEGGGGRSQAKRNYLTWWDHQGNQGKLHKKIFTEFAQEPGGMEVRYTFRNASKMGQALQLAKQSDQLPDIHTNAGLLLPVPQLIKAGWIGPLHLSDAAMKRLKGHLVDGIHIYDGKVYSFPQFNFRTYSSATWFNTDLVKKAGLDPAQPPVTYDEFRDACRAVQKASGGKAYGFIWNAGMPPRMADQVDKLAQAAGFEGGGVGELSGMLYQTGEYAFHSDPYLNVIELLVALNKDKLFFPGSINFSDRIARARWASGVAAYYIDGPWNPGVIRESLPSFAKKLGVGPILVPQPNTSPRTYGAQMGGVFWRSPSMPTAQEKASNQLLGEHFTTHEYFVQLANSMPQPPLDLSAVAESDAYPAYKTLVKWMADQCFLSPNPIVRNVEINKVQAETKPVQPTLGNIVQGALSGDVSDVKSALKQLSDKTSAERDRAIKAAKAKGAKVSLDDYAFPDWRPGTDFTKDMYGR